MLTRQMDVETLCFHGAGQERPRKTKEDQGSEKLLKDAKRP